MNCIRSKYGGFLRGNSGLYSALRFYVKPKDEIENLVKSKKVVVFMKGTPDAPRCGFSNAVVQVLRFHGVKDFQAHDVLDDEDLRQGGRISY